MDNKTLVSDANIKSITREMVQDLLLKIKNKDLLLPYSAQLTKSTYLKIDGNGNMYLSNNGQYIDLGNISKDKLDIEKIYQIFNIVINNGNLWYPNKNYKGMPTSRYQFGCVSYDGKIYCIGGNNNINVLNKVEVYDINSNTWSSNYNPMPTIRYQFGSIQYNNRIYCIGGYPNTNIIEGYQLPYKTFNIPIPDVVSNKLSKIVSNGDGSKIFHNDGKYKSITPVYNTLTSDQVDDILEYAFV